MEEEDLLGALEEMSEEGRQALLNRCSGWNHPGRVAQRWIAGILFVLGSYTAVILICTIFILIGIWLNVIFLFGWLIYGGWFYVMIGKPMSVSLKFFWIASIAVHSAYAFALHGKTPNETVENFSFLSPEFIWGVAIGLSALALLCELWVLSGSRLGRDRDRS